MSVGEGLVANTVVAMSPELGKSLKHYKSESQNSLNLNFSQSIEEIPSKADITQLVHTNQQLNDVIVNC